MFRRSGQALSLSRYVVFSERCYAPASSKTRYRLVLSTRSGALLFLSMELAENLRAGRIPADPRLTERLEAAEILVPARRLSEFDALRARNTRAIETRETATFTLVPTAFCNMGCSYCGQSHHKARLSSHTIASIEARVLNACDRPGIRHIHLCWFGGEPASALDILEAMSARLIPRVREKGRAFTSSMVTNGVLLSVETVERLADACLITSFTITVDGPQAAHDRSRPLRNGRSSHSALMDLLAGLARRETLRHVQFVIRTNVSRLNCDALPGFFAECAASGLDVPNISFELSPVYAWSNDVSAIELERQHYADLEASLLCEMALHGLRSPVVPRVAHAVTCVAVDGQAEVIGPDGALFSCTEQVLVPKLRSEAFGSVHGRSPRPLGRYDAFNLDAVADLPCAGCVMFGLCGGACPKHWEEGVTPCPSYKFNIQDRLDIGAAQAGMLIAS